MGRLPLASLAVLVVVLACPLSAHGAACDMTVLRPVLESADMTLCRQITGVTIPVANISPSYVGIQAEYLDSEACVSPSCGRAIAALKALKTGECQLTANACYRGGCVDFHVSLYAQHIDVVETFCNGNLNVGGTGTEPPTSAPTRPGPPLTETPTQPGLPPTDVPSASTPPSASSTSTSTASPTLYPRPTSETTPSEPIPAPSVRNETSSAQPTNDTQPSETIAQPEAQGTASPVPSPKTSAVGGSGYTAASVSAALASIAVASVLL